MKTCKICVVMLMLVLMIPKLNPMDVKAANTTDKVFSFNLYSTSGAYAVGNYESKENSSSVYLYSDSMTNTLNSVYVKIYGSKHSSGYSATDRTYLGRKYYYTGTGISRAIYSTVYETDCKYAALAARGRTGIGTATGKWSPDSAGSYAQMSYE